MCLLGWALCLPYSGHGNSLNSKERGYPSSLQTQLQELQKKRKALPNNPDLLIQLANIYLDVGDDLYSDTAKRVEAYQAGADSAEQALVLNPQDANAHFLYAANLGHIAQLKGVLVSAWLIREIKGHVQQSIELAPNHAPALHMMGMILDGLPWFLGGDEQEAVSYVKRAVVADPSYTHARLNLGKLYLKQERIQEARKHFLLVTETQSPRGEYAWAHRHKPEALQLLQQMK